MNSGKSDTLIKTAYNYTERGLAIITMKPTTDTKDATHIIARAGGKVAVDILTNETMNVRDEIKSHIARHGLDRLHCVLIDESQFLTADQIEQLFEVAKLDNISVIAYGLRADFQTRLFPGSERLLALADNIEKLPTMCRCGSQAEFNCRQIGGQFVFEGAQVAIDGQDATYDSLCGNCFMTERVAAAS